MNVDLCCILQKITIWHSNRTSVLIPGGDLNSFEWDLDISLQVNVLIFNGIALHCEGLLFYDMCICVSEKQWPDSALLK